KPDQVKIGWTYDFDQIERVTRSAEKATGYGAVMEVVQFVMAEADRRHRSALRTILESNAALERERDEFREAYKNQLSFVFTQSEMREMQDRAEAAEARLAEAMKALGMMLKEHDILSGNFGDVMDPKHKRPDRWPTAAEADRRALEGDGR